VPLSNRQVSILFSVIDEYVRSAEPVASQAIVEARAVDASPATVRSEMVALEGAGYLAQPHASAGRVPTETAYRLYIAYLQQQRNAAAASVVGEIAAVVTRELGDIRTFGKALARTLAELASQAIVIGFSRGDAYATGISYVIVQPEFQDLDARRSFSAAVDRLDETLDALDGLLNAVPSEASAKEGRARVVLGSENPFGPQVGTVASHLALPEGHTLTLGIVGPMRMAYDRNLGLMETVRASVRENSCWEMRK
jgi:transcriptional regulator of heat shock response